MNVSLVFTGRSYKEHETSHIVEPLESVSCDFEGSYICGYQFVDYTAYKWRRHQGKTPTLLTGPVVDHTTYSDKG